MIKIYGIPNCDTMKKARKWLEKNNLDYEFYDYKKLGVPEKNLKQWVKKAGWETVLNKRGTTWRQLDDKTKAATDESNAAKLLAENPAMIKRPILIQGKNSLVGFSTESY